jgi:hypothetical protein
MSATETVEAGTPTGELALTTADPQAGDTTATDGQPEGTEAGKDQAKAATLLTDPPKEEAAAAPVVPEAYEIALPKESPVGADVLAKVADLAKGLSVTDSARVQAIVDLIHGEAVQVLEAQQEALKKGGTLWTQTVQRLEADALADPDIGGTPERLQATVQKAKAALAEFGGDEFSTFLEDTGLGSDKRLIKAWAKVAERMQEDRLIAGEPPKPRPKSIAKAIYPNLPSEHDG